ncbi:hypothetical protein [Alkaliphilus transvaalensis]|uniref:hypothetical protein n=1 Tax=Alkaliphilus transvaalensis TaxID=114628 RepID=UPI00047E5E2E|nr:hypothetical protein [Alkaliphilus transvaalensis]
MKLHQEITCPQCLNNGFTAKYESTYVYSYKIEEHNQGKKSEDDVLPFLFDNREQKDAKQYIECGHCHAQYPCRFTLDSNRIDFTIVQKALRGDYAKEPEFFG